MAELEAKNVTANQLSDISQQVGWVGGITYMGIAGWTQTEYGTLIPPAGFFIGNIIPGYSAGFYDATGTLQLGFGTDGTITGAQAGNKIDTFNGSDVLSYSTTPGTQRVIKNFNVEDSDGLVNQNVSTGEITFNQTGVYLVGWVVDLEYPAAAGNDKHFICGFGNGVGGYYSNLTESHHVGSGVANYRFSGTFPLRQTGGISLYVVCSDDGVASGTRDVECPNLWFMYVKAL